MSEGRRRGGQFVRRVQDIDTDAMTCTCPVHGEGARLRVRQCKTGKSYRCRACDRGTGPKSAGTKGLRTTEGRRAAHLLKAYGMTWEEYRVRLEAQQGRCLICQDELVGTPYVDHCHARGHVRGLLCRGCNSGLGMFRDNPDVLRRAIKYLQRYQREAV